MQEDPSLEAELAGAWAASWTVLYNMGLGTTPVPLSPDLKLVRQITEIYTIDSSPSWIDSWIF